MSVASLNAGSLVLNDLTVYNSREYEAGGGSTDSKFSATLTIIPYYDILAEDGYVEITSENLNITSANLNIDGIVVRFMDGSVLDPNLVDFRGEVTFAGAKSNVVGLIPTGEKNRHLAPEVGFDYVGNTSGVLPYLVGNKPHFQLGSSLVFKATALSLPSTGLGPAVNVLVGTNFVSNCPLSYTNIPAGNYLISLAVVYNTTGVDFTTSQWLVGGGIDPITTFFYTVQATETASSSTSVALTFPLFFGSSSVSFPLTLTYSLAYADPTITADIQLSLTRLS